MSTKLIIKESNGNVVEFITNKRARVTITTDDASVNDASSVDSSIPIDSSDDSFSDDSGADDSSTTDLSDTDDDSTRVSDNDALGPKILPIRATAKYCKHYVIKEGICCNNDCFRMDCSVLDDGESVFATVDEYVMHCQQVHACRPTEHQKECIEQDQERLKLIEDMMKSKQDHLTTLQGLIDVYRKIAKPKDSASVQLLQDFQSFKKELIRENKMLKTIDCKII